MPQISIKKDELLKDGKPFFVYSGEIHYFRIKRTDWPDRIRKAKKAGLNSVSSYIPWRWHEPDQGGTDFTGKTLPERDLAGFLKLLKKEKLNFIARIGPVSNGEIINDGLPDWLFEKHPEIRLKDYAGRTNPYSALLDYHHPAFHELIRAWYKELLPLLKEYLAEKNGPVILVQLDNEISMLNWLTKAPAYTPFGDELFRKHLEKTYKDIAGLNKALGTSYSSFEEIRQPDGTFTREKGEFFFEWEEFYREYYALYYKKLYGYLKEHGFNLPVIANIPQIYDYDVKGRGNMGIMTTCMFRNFGKYAKEIIFGGAYQYRRVDYENFTDIAAMSEIVRMITPEGNPMICAEMQTGIMFDRPVLYPSDVELNIKTSIGSGLNGINMYMFAGGENFLNTGGFGTFHNWQAAVSADGKAAPHFEPVRAIGNFLKENGPLITGARSASDVTIGLYAPYYQTEYLKGAFPEDLMRRRDTKLFDGLLRLLRLAGFQYSFIDLKEASFEKLKSLEHLWVFSLEFMDSATQDKLVRLAREGKHILFYPVLPLFDLNFRPCEILKEALGISDIKERLGANRIRKPESSYLYYGGDEVHTFTLKEPSSPLFLAEDGPVVCFIDKNRRVIVCGFDLTHKFDYQIGFIKEFAALLGVAPEVQNANPRLSVAYRRSDKADILFAANYTEMEEKTSVNLKSRPFPKSMELTLPGRKALILFANFKVAEDLTVMHVNAEILKIRKNSREVRLLLSTVLPEIRACFSGNYSVKGPARMKLVKKSGSCSMVSFPSSGETTELIFRKIRSSKKK